jgi:hypothetical protein
MIIKNADDIAKRANSTVDEFVRQTWISLFSGTIRDTRVDTGRMRDNWQCTVGSAAKGTVPISSEAETIANMKNNIGGAGDTTYLTNNVPYVGVWEERDGMVAKNIARIETNIRKFAK